MVESFHSCERGPPCKTKKGMLEEAASMVALLYLLTYLYEARGLGADIGRRRIYLPLPR